MKLDDFMPYVLADVLGCPDPALRQALASAAIEFCRTTLAWTEIQDPIALVDGQSDYDIDAPSQALTLTVRDVWVNGRRLNPAPMTALQLTLPDWATATGNEPSYYNAMVERGAIRVFPTPANANGQVLTVRAAYAPVFGATSLPDFLGQRYMESIASGAKARLMAMPGQEWTSVTLSTYHRQLFEDAKLAARVEEFHDRVPGTVTVRPRSFGF